MPLLAASAAVLDLHTWWAWVVVVGNGLVGAWALAADRYEPVRSQWLWRTTTAAQVAVFVQVVLGVLVLQGAGVEQSYQFHMLYGFSAAFAVAIIYAYRSQLQPYVYRLYGVGGLFIMGLGLRAMVLHP